MLRCRVRFLNPADVLAEAREKAADVLVAERLRLSERGLWILTRHETTNGAPGQRQVRNPLAQHGTRFTHFRFKR